MPTLTELIRDARVAVAKESADVAKDQKRQDKFKTKFKHAKAQAKKYAKKPLRHKFWQARQARNAAKIIYWSKQEADDIEEKRDAKSRVDRLKKKKAALQPNGAKLATTAHKYIGTNEGSGLQVKWANNLGYSAALPWCSIFVANMLIEAGICDKGQLPSNPAYSGAWLNWSRGKRVNRSEVRAGDLLIFDWGDGGITDHVAIYAGGNSHIGGNQSDQVNQRVTPWSNVVAIIRPL